MISNTQPQLYWEQRAQRYATQGEGLAAVCSYGMPEFYNRAIQFTQRLALRPWLKQAAGKEVLDVGCGVGRWSRWMATRGGSVTGVDLSPTMIAEAARRAAAEGVSARCKFLVQDLTQMNTGHQYDLIVGVTVLQHILDAKGFTSAIRALAGHLKPEGRLVLVEAAPTRAFSRCDTPIFRARNFETYLATFAACGLQPESIRGLDPMPLKQFFLPFYRRLPKPLAITVLGAVTVLSLPVDAALGRRLAMQSWHKLFVLKHGAES